MLPAGVRGTIPFSIIRRGTSMGESDTQQNISAKGIIDLRPTLLFLLKSWRYIPAIMILRLIVMAGKAAMKSAIRRLNKTSTQLQASKQQSVVYMNHDGTIDWPENPNDSGVLVVPRPCKNANEWDCLIKRIGKPRS